MSTPRAAVRHERISRTALYCSGCIKCFGCLQYSSHQRSKKVARRYFFSPNQLRFSVVWIAHSHMQREYLIRHFLLFHTEQEVIYLLIYDFPWDEEPVLTVFIWLCMIIWSICICPMLLKDTSSVAPQKSHSGTGLKRSSPSWSNSMEIISTSKIWRQFEQAKFIFMMSWGCVALYVRSALRTTARQ